MKISNLAILVAVAAFQCGTAFADHVTIRNEGSRDLFVTVRDVNQSGDPIIMDSKRVNAGADRTVDAELNGDGNYSLSWSAVEVQDHDQTNSGDCEALPTDPCRVSGP